MSSPWIEVARRQLADGTAVSYVYLHYETKRGGRTVALGRLPDSPTGLLDLVLNYARHTRSVTILQALRDSTKDIRCDQVGGRAGHSATSLAGTRRSSARRRAA